MQEYNKKYVCIHRCKNELEMTRCTKIRKLSKLTQPEASSRSLTVQRRHYCGQLCHKKKKQNHLKLDSLPNTGKGATTKSNYTIFAKYDISIRVL